MKPKKEGSNLGNWRGYKSTQRHKKSNYKNKRGSGTYGPKEYRKRYNCQ